MKKGFTLIELVIVVLIIAVLAMILVPQIARLIAKGRDSKRMEDIFNLASALQTYYLEEGAYPPVTDDDSDGWDLSNDGVFIPQLQAGGYITEDVADPINDDTYYYAYRKFSSGDYGASTDMGDYVAVACKSFEVLPSVPGSGDTLAPDYDWDSEFAFYILLFEE